MITTKENHFDIIIVGAGWAGMYMLYKARKMGLNARVIEAEPEVGGTWYRNRYPGLRCDVESLEYSMSFSDELQQEWSWSEKFASQPEILEYARYLAKKFDLRKDIQFNTRVESATYDEASKTWQVNTSRDENFTCQYCVMATGALSVPKTPDIPGVSDFKGEVYYSTDWPHEKVDFTGKKVGVIGTGSTGIQIIPIVAEECDELYVFQRTPSYSLPAHNKPMDPEYETVVKQNYKEHRQFAKKSFGGAPFVNPDLSALQVSPAERYRVYKELYNRGAPFAFQSAFNDILISEDANRTAAEFAENEIRKRINDPELADILIPKDQYIGTRRLCIDTNYYETYNKDHVNLVSILQHPIKHFTAEGIQTSERLYKLDSIIFATGYDALTGALLNMNITGKKGIALSDKWKDAPATNLGVMVSGFPNMFIVTGPGSPSVLSNVIVSIEQHVDWISDCIGHVRSQGKSCIETTEEAETTWMQHVTDLSNATLFPRGNSWYLGANIPGKPRFFMVYVGGVGTFREICNKVANSGYEGFEIH